MKLGKKAICIEIGNPNEFMDDLIRMCYFGVARFVVSHCLFLLLRSCFQLAGSWGVTLRALQLWFLFISRVLFRLFG